MSRGCRWLLWPFLPFLKTCATLVSFAWLAPELVSRVRETTTFFDRTKERLLSCRLGVATKSLKRLRSETTIFRAKNIGLCSAALLVVFSEVSNGCGVRAVIFAPWRIPGSFGGSPGGPGGVHLGASGVPLEAYMFILVLYYT